MDVLGPASKQTWAISSILLSLMGQGMLMGHASCLYPALMDPKSDIKADTASITWMVSSVGTLVMLGLIVASLLMEWWGRKTAFLVTSTPAIIGWVVTYYATSVAMLTIGRILGGITCGALAVLGAIITGEFASPRYRGTFLNLKTASVCLGSTVVHGLGNFFHWRTVALVALTLNVISFLIACTWPESPAWLASKKKFEKCEQSFRWLRRTSDHSVWEADELIKSQKANISDQRKNTKMTTQILNILKTFTQRAFIQPVFIIFLGGILLEASGRYIFPAYAAQILEQITETKSQSSFYMLSIDVIITASATLSSVLVRIMKRRTLLFYTAIPALIVLLFVCLYLYLVDINVLAKGRPWIAASLFIVYFILANLGCTPIPVALCGEVYPLSHRGSGSMAGGILFNLGLILFLKYTPYLLQSVKVHGTFGVFGLVMAATLLTLYFVMPETKDKTLQEIDDYFHTGKFKDSSKEDEARAKMVQEEEIAMA